VLIAGIVGWFGFAFWITRRRKIDSLETLGPASSDFDLDKIKQKYLRLIDECYQNYQHNDASLRGLHRGLSLTVRYFVYEAKHFPAPHLTLADLRRAPYPSLTKLITNYYVDEFAVIERGDPQASVEAAKDLVRQWV
jgi:hypothetical protein